MNERKGDQMQAKPQLDLVWNKIRHVTHEEKAAPDSITAKDNGQVPAQGMLRRSASDLNVHLVLRSKQERSTDHKDKTMGL